MLFAFVESLRKKGIVLGSIFAVDALGLLISGVVLGWIEATLSSLFNPALRG